MIPRKNKQTSTGEFLVSSSIYTFNFLCDSNP